MILLSAQASSKQIISSHINGRDRSPHVIKSPYGNRLDPPLVLGKSNKGKVSPERIINFESNLMTQFQN